MSSTVPMLETKLYVPRPPAGSVARPRLMQRFRAAARSKLTVVSAPAGSGKTTLVAEWLSHRTSDLPPIAWVSLDAADNDAALFWTCVIRALQRVRPDFGTGALTALQSAASAPPTTAALVSLLNEINATDLDVVLVLDDYHVVETPAIHTAVAFFLDHLPPRMHVIIATRSEPLLPLARMRARGEVLELRAADLRFTTEEAEQFLRASGSIELTNDQISELEKRTEGWIAGLKLAALSMENQKDVPAFIRSFSGNNRYVADYLVDEVLQAQSESVRTFLMSTSMLDRLSARLCDGVTGGPNSQSVLEMLESSNLFVVALDDRREWYRYHHLFAEVLQAHALRADPQRVRELHARASVWYEQNGAVNDAVQHALRAHDLERVAELLERNWPEMNRSYQSVRWLERVKALPRTLVAARPVLNMGFARALMNAGELEAADVQLREVEAMIDGAATTPLTREVATARVYLAQSRGDFAATVLAAQRNLELVPEGDHATRSTAAALLALAQWAHGELEAAYDMFASALRSMHLAGVPHDAVRGMFVVADLRVAQGRLRDAMRAYQAGIEAAIAQGPTDGLETDELYLGLIELHHERGEEEEAATLLAELEQRVARATQFGNRHRRYLAMARIAQANGDLAEAIELVNQAEACYRRDPVPVPRPFAAIRARLWITQGNLGAATRWLHTSGLGDADDLSYMREYEHITLARLMITQRDFDQAISLLERLTAAAMQGGRGGSVIELLVLQGLAHYEPGNTRAALDAVAEALERAEPEGYVRVFVDEGVRMRDLLRQAIARGVAGSYTRHILGFFDESSGRVTTGSAGAPGLLTTRELEILRLIAAGMRNREIATQLFISTATVKRHIANVYNKLNATHRTEALKQATALKLL